MTIHEDALIFSGPAGAIETRIDVPAHPRGLALVCHPHPLFGGANTNKVVHTLAKTLAALGYLALRPNFRGVGASAGTHTHGQAETDDMLALIAQAQAQFGDTLPGKTSAGKTSAGKSSAGESSTDEIPLVLAGFSFGGYVITRVAAALAESGQTIERIVLVAPATGHIAGDREYTASPVGSQSLIIHGALDDTVPLANVLAWAEPQNLPVVVIPGADHFFHGRLQTIRDIVRRNWPC